MLARSAAAVSAAAAASSGVTLAASCSSFLRLGSRVLSARELGAVASRGDESVLWPTASSVHTFDHAASSNPSASRAAMFLKRMWLHRQHGRSVWMMKNTARADDLIEDCHLQAPEHRPVLKMDMDRCIHVGGRKLSVEPLQAFGLRIQDKFCTELQSHMVLMEVHELLTKFGYSLPDDSTPVYTMSSLREVTAMPMSANTVRCCGARNSHYHPARDADQVAPWGHGDKFDVSKVPPKLRSILESIQKSPLFALGKPRTISINRRCNSFFKLDPHINDLNDGENVFTLNLNSNSVYTFTPPGKFQREDPVQCATQSWSDKDIDVLLRHRSLMLTSGSSRREWRHAVRSGVQVQLDGGADAICDWWGTTRNLVRRSPEKVTIIFGFGRTAVETEAEADAKAAHAAADSIGRW